MAITKIGTPELFDFSATNTALQLPTGDTASRPTSPSTGEWRFNSELKYVEYYDGASWFQIDTDTQVVPFTPSENFNVNTYFGNGATQVIDAKFNEAANFNGSSSVIDISSSLINPSSPYTISMWFNANTASSYEGFYTGISLSPVVGELTILKVNATTIQVFSAATPGSNNLDALTATVPTLSNSTWYNLVVIADRSLTYKSRVFINGVEGTSYTAGSASTNLTSTIKIGFADNNYFDGKIDQVRIYDSALSQSAVTALQLETTTTASSLSFPTGETAIATYQLDGNGDDISTNYNATSTTDIGYTGLKFQPDFVWTKSRDAVNRNQLFDSVRGATKAIESDTTFVESTEPTALTAFDTDGFSLGSSSNVNSSGTTYVAWNWKAGGAPTATNSAGAGNVPTSGSVMIDGVASTAALAGTIAATKISANTAAGFSIVNYDGAGVSGSATTVGHGLNAVPELIIIKAYETGLNDSAWFVYTSMTGNTKELYLNTTGKAETDSNRWEATSPSSTVFTLGSSFSSFPSYYGGDTIAYCFHSVAGYSKIGTYVGVPNAQSIVTGFKPAWVMIKNTNDGYSWVITDDKRTTDKILYANLSQGEDTTSNGITSFNSNPNGGFTLGTAVSFNQDTDVYIYMAFAAT